MSKKGLVIRLAGKFLLIITLIVVGSFFVRSPVVSNELAMTQMQNDNALYVAMEATNKLRNVVAWLVPCVNFVIGLTAGRDITKYIDHKKKLQKENT